MLTGLSAAKVTAVPLERARLDLLPTPGFVAAVLVLALNDHVLEAEEIAPEEFTPKVVPELFHSPVIAGSAARSRRDLHVERHLGGPGE